MVSRSKILTFILQAIQCLAISLFLIGITSAIGYAQKSKSQLEKEKEENLHKISETHKILNETKSKKQATLGQLSAIQQQIQARNSLINSISEELAMMDTEIYEMEDIIQSLEHDILVLKKEYSAMIYSEAKSQEYFDKLTFIFAAQTFNQLVNRVQYFKQYAEAKKYQVKQIQSVKKSLSGQKLTLRDKREEKNVLLTSKTIETQSLNQLKDHQSLLVSELTQKERELKNELNERKKSVKKLEKLITDLITIEKERAMKEAAKKSNPAKVASANETSTSFALNNTKLPWPVVHGSISNKFGKQAHPVLKGVYIDNLGIDIQTLKNEPVRSVFKGKVITVASVPGMNNVVMIQHGEYFTVYAKLKSVMVVTGQEVKAKEILGEVYTDKNDVSELQFQVWKNSEKLDPQTWLINR